MGNVNVLVADHNNASGFFLKSVLRGDNYGVSVSLQEHETLAKLSTGLFDAMVCDMDLSVPAGPEFLRSVNELLPGMPLVVLYGQENLRLDGVDFFCGMDKPLRVSAVLAVMKRVRNMVTSLENRRRFPRREVNLPAELSADGRTIFCRATNLSAGGMQVETLSKARVRRGLEALFRDRNPGTILARVFLGGRRVWEFKTKLAYIERFRFHQPEQVGLSFDGMKESQKSELAAFLVAAS